MSEFEGVFSTLRVLFEVAGQAPVAVGAGAEGGLDAPAERQRGLDRGTRVDRVDLGALDGEPVLDRPLQEKFGRLGVVDTGGRDDDGQDEPQRAAQNMALDAFDFLVAVKPPLTLLRT